MKKGIIVLLITVLAAGMAFAGVTGSAATQFTFNLDEGKGYGFGASNSQGLKYTFDFTVDAATVDNAEHQTDIWAEIGADAKVSIAGKEKKSPDIGIIPYIDTLEITKANIHIKDITVDILGPQVFFDYASSFTTKTYYTYYKASVYDMTSDDAVFGTKVGAGGVNVIYDGYTFAFAFNNAVTDKTDDETTYGEPYWMAKKDWNELPDDAAAAGKGKDHQKNYVLISSGDDYVYVAKITKTSGDPKAEDMVLYAGLETKAYEFGEGATAQIAVNFKLNRDMLAKENSFIIGGSAYAGYEADKLSASVAVDGRLDMAGEEKEIKLDALVSAQYDFVNAKVYFGTDNLGKEGAEYILEAKIGADIPVSDEIVLKITGEADSLDLAKKADAFKAASYKATVGTTVAKLTLGAEFGWNVGINFDKKGNTLDKGMKIAANIAYALDVATVKGSISVNFLENAEKKNALYAIRPAVSVESSSIIENCTLSLGWSGASFEKDGFTPKAKDTASKGAINASAKISF